MKRAQRPLTSMRFVEALRKVLENAPVALSRQNLTLAVLDLNDETGFQLALKIHRRIKGPNPAEIRERANLNGAQRPLIAAASPFRSLFEPADPLSTHLENLASLGETPVVIVRCGLTEITTLEAIEEEAKLREQLAAIPMRTPSRNGPIGLRTQANLPNDPFNVQPWFQPITGKA
ncbi:MAG: hypothetical protein IPK82_20030 [Polyangiaceae bacterium]|nr:hypothetical protein [Polyangiaceae bacterium]